MPRKFPKPFFRTGRGWYVQLGKRQVKLADGPQSAATEAAAWTRFHELMADRQRSAGSAPPATAAGPSGPAVVDVFDKFRDWCHKHREPRTYEWYRDHLQSFVRHAGRVVLRPADALKPFHVVEWADAHPGWGPGYRRGAIVAVQRAFNWAAKLGHIPATPVPHIEKPRPQRREQLITPADWNRIRARYPAGDPFAELLEFAWETGCRPQEAKRIEARHVQLARQRAVFPPGEAKGGKRARVIHLTPRAAEILGRLLRARGDGPLFVNAAGNPWTAQAMACRFGRLKKHLGVKFAAYDFRHGFCQRLLESGADHLTVAELLGHADGKMVATVYSHLGSADRHLRDTLTRAAPGAGA